MARSIKCPHCGQVLKVAEQAAGKRVDCPACKKAFRAPKALAVAPPDKPTEPAAAPPPPPTAPAAAAGRLWFFHIDGRNDGPHTVETVLDQVKMGRLDADTLVWKEGMGDWQPLREVKEFRGAFSSPPPVSPSHLHKPHPPKPHDHHGHGAEHQPRPHYSRGKTRRDLAIGLWVAGALGLAALIALVLVLNRKDEPPAPKQVIVSHVDTSVQVLPTTETAVDTKGTPTPPPKKAPKAQVPNQKLMATAVADIEAGFKAAIEGHKRADARPILKLIEKCRKHSDQLSQRDWGIYKDVVAVLAVRLGEAGKGLYDTLKERSVAWGLGDGLDPKMKAKTLQLDEYAWLTNWQKILADEFAKVRKKGLDF